MAISTEPRPPLSQARTATRSRLPSGRIDVLRQLLLLSLAYGAYELVRGLVAADGRRPFNDAGRIIALERSLHVFIEPNIERWVNDRAHWLMLICDWVYLNAHFLLTAGVLVFIYLRRNGSFYFVRNMFMLAMALALIGYTLFPTAPPRLMPQWGFSDPIQQFTATNLQHGASAILFNPYAAVPSLHVCFAVMVGCSMARLVHHPLARAAWALYPFLITFVVVATGNHYLTDVALGACTAGLAALGSHQLLARARPRVWAFAGAHA